MLTLSCPQLWGPLGQDESLTKRTALEMTVRGTRESISGFTPGELPERGATRALIVTRGCCTHTQAGQGETRLSRGNFLVVTGVTFWTQSLLEPGQAHVHGVPCPVC